MSRILISWFLRFVSLLSVIEISRVLPQVGHFSSVCSTAGVYSAGFIDSHPSARAFEGDREGRTESVTCFCWLFRESSLIINFSTSTFFLHFNSFSMHLPFFRDIPRRLPYENYPLHRIRLFSLTFSPRFHYAGLPGRTRGKRGGGGL